MSDNNPQEGRGRVGPIAWMVKNPVTANLLMAAFIVGGLLMSQQVKHEVFPEFDLDIIRVSVPYPGASPEEVEQGIVLAVEEAVRGIDGVKKVRGVGSEGMATVNVELLFGADGERTLSDVKNAVDRITSFPEDAERPTISHLVGRWQVLSLILHGQQSEETLRRLAEQVRGSLMDDPRITQVELSGVRPREISVELPRSALRAYGLTLAQVAAAVRASSVDLPGGSVRTSGGEVLVRTTERRDIGREFSDITLLASATGTRVRLGDIAHVSDGFAETDQEATFDGRPAVMLVVYRVGEQRPTEVAGAVREYIEKTPLPAGVKLNVWDDRSEVFADRADLLLRNAALGLVLVLLALGLFLELKLAFWVMVGIPISFLGTFLLMPAMGVSLNIISMFAFIVVLGIVVDDAILVGENVYRLRQKGMPPLQAAIAGAREVATPVTFAVATTIAAFGPLLFVPGFMGKIFSVIPLIVIAVIAISLVESLFIMPAHLAHSKPGTSRGVFGLISRLQRRVASGLERSVHRWFQPLARAAIRHRYLTTALATAVLLVVVGLVGGQHIQFTFFPKVEGDLVTASARLPVGASLSDARLVRERLTATLQQVVRANSDERLVRGVYAQIGSPVDPRAAFGSLPETGAHVVDVALLMVRSGQREVTAATISNDWRNKTGTLTGVRTLAFRYGFGPSAGSPIDIQLMHPDTRTLEAAAASLAQRIQAYRGVKDVDAGFSNGKAQLDVTLKPTGRALGLTESSLARQLRSALYGAEALRQQRGRDEVRVMVRLPREDRAKLFGLEQYRLRTPAGVELPLAQVARLEPARAYTSINRVDGRRVLNVTGEVEQGVGNANQILSRIQAETMPPLLKEFPGLRYSLEGERREQQDSIKSLMLGTLAALLGIYALLAIPFRSYIQPLIVMSVIPFGFIGAVLGHVLLGYNLSIISIFGLIALSGIVVNDSLVLIVTSNRLRQEGLSATEAVVRGAMRRFRPILLTSLTTFFGLIPIIFETSNQARFLIPMAISLGFGVLFVTVLVLVLVPALYLMVEDAKALARRLRRAPREDAAPAPEPASR